MKTKFKQNLSNSATFFLQTSLYTRPNNDSMLKHHSTLIIRNLLKYKSSFIINLIGLSAGLASALLIFLWVKSEINVDKFHTKGDRLVQIMEHQKYADGDFTVSSTPGLLAETLKEEFPEFEFAATTTWINKFTLSYEEKDVAADGYYVGSDFFSIFSYNLIAGQPEQVLKELNSIVISEPTAISLFGSVEEAIGKQIDFQHAESLMITGVFEEIPKNSSYHFDLVRPFEKFKLENEWVTNWGSNGPSTYAVLKEGTELKALAEKIADFVKTKDEESNVTLFLQPYSERYLYGSFKNRVQSGGRITYVRLFSIIAVFILLIAAINFMNLSTARASRRAKEIGLKKTVGASKSGLVTQFLLESIFISLVSLLVAIGLVYLALPEFNTITEKQLSLDLEIITILGIFGFTILTGLFAGSYPAFYMSGFNPVSVLKGTIIKSAGEIWARQGLVIFQFSISIILIVAVTVVYKQIQYVQNTNLGFNKENMIRFGIQGKLEENKDAFLAELQQLNGVNNASYLGHSFLGRNNNTSGLNWEGKDPEARILFENLAVNYDLVETMGIEIIEGRSFNRNFADDTTSIIINEAALEVMGLEDPIGKVVNLWGTYDLEVVGVAKNFHFQSLHNQVEPVFLWVNKDNTWNFMVNVDGKNTKETLTEVENLYKKFNPGFTFYYQFLDLEYAKQYASEERVATLAQYFAAFAILISCLGLFGLASFTAERRLKEIGIRKALGSTVSGIVILLSKDFTRLVFISILISLPISYFLLEEWLGKFAFRIDLSIWFFVFSGITAILITWLTVGFQSFWAASVNPTKCLRDS